VAVTARTEAERTAAIEELLAAGREAIVQELLSGPRWFAHSVGLGPEFRFLAFEALADYPRNSGPASFLRTGAAPPGVREATLRLMELVGYEGPCSLSFIEHDGRLQVHDVNLRLGATVGASIRAGFDIPRLAVDAALGRGAAPEEVVAPALTYVRMDGEWSALIDELRGRGTGEPKGPLAGRLVRGALAPGWMLDPSPLDPFLLSTTVGRRLLGVVRRARRRSNGSVGTARKA
jgi:hypothetical protein